MDDSSVVDIYEDLSVDEIATIQHEEEDHRIDLFTEALAISTVDKVCDQLSELKKENEKLRKENAQLKESREQLGKNISSLFLTARREIQKKEQELAKLLSDRQGVSCEKCKVMPDTSSGALRKGKLFSKQPTDECVSSLTESITCPKEEITLSEISDQSNSLSISQGVGSRKKMKDAQNVNQEAHKRHNIAATTETHHTFHREVKLQDNSSRKGRDPFECKQNNAHAISCASGHIETRVSKGDITTDVKGRKSVAQKNKLGMSDVETHQYVKVRKIEMTCTNVIRNLLIEDNENVGNTEQKADSLEHHSEPNSFSIDRSTTVSSVIKPACTNTKLSVDAAIRSENLTVAKDSEKEIDNTILNCNFSAKESLSAAFNTKGTSKNHSTKHLQRNEKYSKTNGNKPVLKISRSGSASEAVIPEKCGDSAYSNAKLEDIEISHVKSDTNPVPYKSENNTASLAVASDDCGESVPSISSEKAKVNRHTVYNGGISERSTRHAASSREFRKSNGSVKNSNSNQSESCYVEKISHSNKRLDSDTDVPFEVNAVGNNANIHHSYITCTSNLILLGDEETTCMTIISPNKIQPSEFYPPGVRGDVHEGGSHVRHIRGVTEVIKKLPTDISWLFHNERENAVQDYSTVVDRVQIKTVTNDSDTQSLISDNTSDCCKTFNLQNMHKNERQNSPAKEHVRNICKDPKVKLKSQACDKLEDLQTSSVEHNRKSCQLKVCTDGSQLSCGTRQTWASTVHHLQQMMKINLCGFLEERKK